MLEEKSKNKQGKLIVFSAPSGSGKTTIVRHLLGVDNLNLEEVRNTAPNRIRILNQSSFAFSNIEKKAIGILGLNK